MTDAEPADAFEEWGSLVEDVNAAVLRAVGDGMEAQAAVAESWFETVSDSTADAFVEDGVEGYARAYEAWMDAAREGFERMSDAIEGEEVPPEEFRDIWLNTANDAFKEVMSTTAFAAATGESVEDVLDFKTQVDEATARALHNAGLPAERDVREVGERLVELERRQHAVERKLDRVLGAVGEADDREQ